MSNPIRSLVIGATLLLCATVSQAAPFSFFGSFTRDDDTRLFSFTTNATGAVTIETYGYAGGVNPNGQNVARGGFDPVFALFNAAGSLLTVGDDGASRIDSVTGGAFDSLITPILAAGSYFLVLGEFDNYAFGPTVGAGFLEAGHGNFTAAFGCAAGRFCDITGDSRTGNFALSISGNTVVRAVVPEPGTLLLLGLGAAGLWLSGRRKSSPQLAI